MILPTLSTTGQVPPQIAAEIKSVRAFIRGIEKDRNGRSIARTPEAVEEDPVPFEEPLGPAFRKGWHAYHYRGLSVFVDPSSSLVMGFRGVVDPSLKRIKHYGFDDTGDDGRFRAPRLVSDEEARKLAKRYYAATGRPYGVYVYSIYDGFGVNGKDLGLTFLPTHKGVPYTDTYYGGMQIDRVTGDSSR